MAETKVKTFFIYIRMRSFFFATQIVNFDQRQLAVCSMYVDVNQVSFKTRFISLIREELTWHFAVGFLVALCYFFYRLTQTS